MGLPVIKRVECADEALEQSRKAEFVGEKLLVQKRLIVKFVKDILFWWTYNYA